jgi:hypothetical protein
MVRYEILVEGVLDVRWSAWFDGGNCGAAASCSPSPEPEMTGKGGPMRTKDPNQVAARYVAIWNGADPERRREGVADLWSEDALHLLQPPQEVYESAAGLQLRPAVPAPGHDELEGRVTSAYEQFVATGQMSFRPRDDASRIGDAVKFHWEGISPSGEVLAVGLELVILAPDGRIQTDYQFIES